MSERITKEMTCWQDGCDGFIAELDADIQRGFAYLKCSKGHRVDLTMENYKAIMAKVRRVMAVGGKVVEMPGK